MLFMDQSPSLAFTGIVCSLCHASTSPITLSDNEVTSDEAEDVCDVGDLGCDGTATLESAFPCNEITAEEEAVDRSLVVVQSLVVRRGGEEEAHAERVEKIDAAVKSGGRVLCQSTVQSTSCLQLFFKKGDGELPFLDTSMSGEANTDKDEMKELHSILLEGCIVLMVAQGLGVDRSRMAVSVSFFIFKPREKDKRTLGLCSSGIAPALEHGRSFS